MGKAVGRKANVRDRNQHESSLILFLRECT